MRTAEIPAKDWSRTLDDFSANHEGSLISVELFGPALGAQSEIHDLPLLGLSIESAGDSTITIAAGRSPEAHITHIIRAPTTVRIERTNDGADVALAIESAEGITALLRLQP